MPTPVTPREIEVTLDRSVTPGQWSAFQACPLTLVCSLPGSADFSTCTRVAAEIFTAHGTDVLAASEVETPGTVTSVDIEFTAAQMNQTVSGRSKKFHIVIYAEYPDDRLEVFRVGDLTLTKHRASQTTPAPPEPAVYLSQAALEAEIAALEDEIAALSSVHNDLTDRDAANAHPMSAITGLSDALSGKAASSHTHAQSDVTNLVADLAGKAASSHTHGMGDVTGLSAALALLAPLASPQLTGRARITDVNNAGLEFWKTTHGVGDRNWEIAVGTEGAGEMELWAGNNGTNNDPRGGTLAARFGVTANSGGPHFTGAVSVGDVAGTRTNLGLGTGDVVQLAGLQFSTDVFLGRAGAADFRRGGADSASPVSQKMSVQNVAAGTLNTPGPDTYYRAAQGTGSAGGGRHVFSGSIGGSSGTGQNGLADLVAIGGVRDSALGYGGDSNSVGRIQLLNASDSGNNSGGVIDFCYSNFVGARITTTISGGNTSLVFYKRVSGNLVAAFRIPSGTSDMTIGSPVSVPLNNWGGVVTNFILSNAETGTSSAQTAWRDWGGNYYAMIRGTCPNALQTGYLEFYTANGAAAARAMTIRANGVINIANLPTSSAGLATGDLWNDSGTLKAA